jgi:nucleoside-diphosphate-sugar epimerase
MNQDPRVLLTGAGGFVGRAVAQQLEARGSKVSGCDLRGATRAIDVLERDALLRFALEVQPTVFVHGAAVTTARRPDELDLLEVNLRGTLNALCAARAVGVAHFVLLSSAGVYAPGQPEPITEAGITSSEHAYSLSKTLAEEMCDLGKSAGMTIRALRLGAVYGPGETVSATRSRGSLVLEIARQLNAARIVLPRAPDDAYNFLHTADLAQLLETIAQRPSDGGTHVYNVGGATTTALELVHAFERVTKQPLEPRVVWNANPAPRHGAIDSSKLKNELGFVADTPLETGLLDYLEAAPMEVLWA